MLLEAYKFCGATGKFDYIADATAAQDLGATLSSTGVVSTNQLELLLNPDGTSLTKQFVEGGVVVTIADIPVALTGGTEGLVMEVRTAAADALTSLYEVLGARAVKFASIVKGAQFFVPIYGTPQAFLGVWFKAVSTTITGHVFAFADYCIEPPTKNEDRQPVRS